MPACLRAAFALFLATLREIFDENAYARYLTRCHATRSSASFREFQRECEHRAHRPRCC